MRKQFMILTTLLSIAEGTMSSEAINQVTQDEKDIVILMARPQDKAILFNYLNSDETSEAEAKAVKAILKKMIKESIANKPMMTMRPEGD